MNYEIEERGDKFVILHCRVALTGPAGAEILRVLGDLVGRLAPTPSLRIVINLDDQHLIDPNTLNGLAALGQRLTELDRKLYFIGVPQATVTALTTVCGSFVHVLYGFPLEKKPRYQPPHEAEMELMEGLGAAVESALKVLCPTLEIKPGKPFLKENTIVPDDLAAQLGLRGKSVDGVLAISFPGPVYLKLLGEMHETTYRNLAEASEDGASELLNIVRSLSRKGLHEKGYVFDKSIPETVKGNVMEKLLESHECTIVVPFESEHGNFHCQIGVTQRKRPA